MPQPELATAETKSERLSMALTASEMEALEFIQVTHGERYEGTSSVLRDYSLTEAVAIHRRARASLLDAPSRRSTDAA